MGDKHKILLVDDERILLELLRTLLCNDYHIVTARNGEEAIIQAKKEAPNLIVLNYMMPVMDGFTACKILKVDEKTKNIPIIILTGNKTIEKEIEGYEIGIDHFIFKPFHPSILKAQIKNSLSRAGHKNLQIQEKVKIPNIFISYKWGSEEENDWVMRLAVDLRGAGINAMLDRWEVRFGDSFTDYMTSKLSVADVMLFIMTPASVAAVEASSEKGGAVKFEMQIASSRKIAGEKFRIIPIYREGNKTAAHVKDHRYVDFRDSANYGINLQLLVTDLLGCGPLAPPIGVRGR